MYCESLQALENKKIGLIITGSISAFKAIELIRQLKAKGAQVYCALTKNAQKFITPLSVETISGFKAHKDLFDEQTTIEHTDWPQKLDAVVIAPCSANFIAKMAHGIADDFASTSLLITRAPIFIAPSMNPKMYDHPSTQSNINILKSRGIHFIGPDYGEMACGDVGWGRMVEPEKIIQHLHTSVKKDLPLQDIKAVVTAGPTLEPIDPVRYLSNHSSGKQGYAIAASLANNGANVYLISGPTKLTPPENVHFIDVQSAQDMHEAAINIENTDIAILSAAVCDWSVETFSTNKIKKSDSFIPSINFRENIDILKSISNSSQRPSLVIGFAAETNNLVENAEKKRKQKNCDWILANKIDKNNPAFGADDNQITFVNEQTYEEWPKLPKIEIAHKLTEKICHYLKERHQNDTNAKRKKHRKYG